jgi:hypothetical protein
MEADSEDCEYILVDFGNSAAAADAVAHAEQLVFEVRRCMQRLSICPRFSRVRLQGLAGDAPRAHFSTGSASFQGEFQHVIGTDMIFTTGTRSNIRKWDESLHVCIDNFVLHFSGPNQPQLPTHAHPLSSRYCVRSFKTLVMSESLPAVNAASAESAPRGER